MSPLLAPFISLVDTVIGKVFPDPIKQAEIKVEILKLEQAGQFKQLEADVSLAMGQMEINKVEAANPSKFVSGWRPSVGWVCVAGLGIQFILIPIASFILTMLGNPTVIPALDVETLLTLLFGLLGLGAFRSYEKVKGVA